MNDGYEDKSHLRINKKSKSKANLSLKRLRCSIKWMKRMSYESFDQLKIPKEGSFLNRINQSYYQEGKKAYKDLTENHDKLNNKEKKEFEELRVYLES